MTPLRRVSTACPAVLLVLAACSPALDWREARLEGGVEALLPCRPRAATREVALAGRPAAMTLLACDAAGRTWAIAGADVGAVERVGPALEQLRQSAAANVGAASGTTRALSVRGASARPSAARVVFDGRRGDARAIRSDVATFAAGTRVYQATVLGESRDDDGGAETFFSSLRVAR